MTDADCMRVALVEAGRSLAEGVQPVGVVVVAGDEIVTIARKSASNFHMGHAEMLALLEVTKDTQYSREDGLALYTTIEPCIMCYGAILHCPITKIVYALEDPWGGATGLTTASLPVRHKHKNPEVVGGVLREESRELMKQFLKVTQSTLWKRDDNIFVQCIRNDPKA